MVKKDKQKIIVWVIVAIFAMNFIPSPSGGMKMTQSTQAIVATEYTCTVDTDCPSCVGGGLVEFNASDPNDFFGELSYSSCNAGTCDLSEFCVIWDCGDTQSACESVKQTLLDNTLAKVQANPTILILLALFLIAYVML